MDEALRLVLSKIWSITGEILRKKVVTMIESGNVNLDQFRQSILKDFEKVNESLAVLRDSPLPKAVSFCKSGTNAFICSKLAECTSEEAKRLHGESMIHFEHADDAARTAFQTCSKFEDKCLAVRLRILSMLYRLNFFDVSPDRIADITYLRAECRDAVNELLSTAQCKSTLKETYGSTVYGFIAGKTSACLTVVNELYLLNNFVTKNIGFPLEIQYHGIDRQLKYVRCGYLADHSDTIHSVVVDDNDDVVTVSDLKKTTWNPMTLDKVGSQKVDVLGSPALNSLSYYTARGLDSWSNGYVYSKARRIIINEVVKKKSGRILFKVKSLVIVKTNEGIASFDKNDPDKTIATYSFYPKFGRIDATEDKLIVCYRNGFVEILDLMTMDVLKRIGEPIEGFRPGFRLEWSATIIFTKFEIEEVNTRTAVSRDSQTLFLWRSDERTVHCFDLSSLVEVGRISFDRVPRDMCSVSGKLFVLFFADTVYTFDYVEVWLI